MVAASVLARSHRCVLRSGTGLVFTNHADSCTQGVRSDGNGVIIVNLVDGPESATPVLEAATDILQFPWTLAKAREDAGARSLGWMGGVERS